jgi:hypothetical protein
MLVYQVWALNLKPFAVISFACKLNGEWYRESQDIVSLSELSTGDEDGYLGHHIEGLIESDLVIGETLFILAGDELYVLAGSEGEDLDVRVEESHPVDLYAVQLLGRDGRVANLESLLSSAHDLRVETSRLPIGPIKDERTDNDLR